jgi:tetratricopeptide (TPR) repeat protein
MELNNLEINEKINKAISFLESENFTESIKLIDELKKDKKTRVIALFLMGIIHIKNNEPSKAKKNFNKVLEKEINHLDANLNLGLIFYNEKNYDRAEFYFNKVLNLNYNHTDAHYHKGLIFFYSKKYEESIKSLEICKKLNNQFYPPFLVLGHIYRETKNFKKAIENYKKFLEKYPDDTTSKFNLAWSYFALSDFENAFKFYEYRSNKIKLNQKTIELKDKLNPIEWNGENINNKKILIISEQGIGDTIQFFRYLYCIKDLYNSEIIFYTDRNLEHLFKDTPFNVVSNLDDIINVDYYQHLLSLPGIFFKKNNQIQKCINYINIDNENNFIWKNKLKKFGKPVIALNWQGSQNYLYDSERSIKLSNLKKIIKDEKFKFISLQKGYGSDQIDKYNLSNFITDLSTEIDVKENSFDDTIHILNNIDLLITSDTAIVHLAGTLNIKTLLMLSFNPDWRWYLETEEYSFYPSVKIIQQNSSNNWENVVENINDELKKIN